MLGHNSKVCTVNVRHFIPTLISIPSSLRFVAISRIVGIVLVSYKGGKASFIKLCSLITILFTITDSGIY